MKTCADCKHRTGSDPEFFTCEAPQNMVMNLVQGKRLPRWKYCEAQRAFSRLSAYLTGSCGPQGRWFELREEKKP